MKPDSPSGEIFSFKFTADDIYGKNLLNKQQSIMFVKQ